MQERFGENLAPRDEGVKPERAGKSGAEKLKFSEIMLVILPVSERLLLLGKHVSVWVSWGCS